jgi:hypothetical protein
MSAQYMVNVSFFFFIMWTLNSFIIPGCTMDPKPHSTLLSCMLHDWPTAVNTCACQEGCDHTAAHEMQIE